MAPTGHPVLHSPHPLHFALNLTCVSKSVTPPIGHKPTQVPQYMQTLGSAFIKSRHRVRNKRSIL
jgi:hypothetical protein